MNSAVKDVSELWYQKSSRRLKVIDLQMAYTGLYMYVIERCVNMFTQIVDKIN
jgi:hypothetical protein